MKNSKQLPDENRRDEAKFAATLDAERRERAELARRARREKRKRENELLERDKAIFARFGYTLVIERVRRSDTPKARLKTKSTRRPKR
jgi:hypothetical protein